VHTLCCVVTVTAAITTFNRAAFLPEALESVLAQSGGDVEVLVVDDGSTDGTADVLVPYLDRIRYVRQDNQGPAAARNTALLEANGRYLSFLDSDDRWLSGKLERTVAVLDANERIAFVHGHIEVIDERGQPLPESTASHRALLSAAHRGRVTYARYANECRCFSSALTARVDTLRAVGMYDTSLALDDYDLYLRVALDYEIGFLEGAPVAQYRLHGDQHSNERVARGQIQTAHKHLALIESRGGVPDERLARRNFALMLSRSYAVLGDQSASRRHLLEAVRLDRTILLRPWVSRRLFGSFLRRTPVATS
jgi:glycosyltransferase involved in cell wall biosynthesis